VRLSQRLLAGFLFVIAVLGTLVVLSSGRSVRDRLRDDTARELLRNAALIGTLWTTAATPDSIADAAGAALGKHVTMIATDGTVVGDSDFDHAALTKLENHRERPEVAAALDSSNGIAIRPSPSTSEETIYAAVATPRGVVRVSVTTATHNVAVRRLQRDVGTAAAVAGLVALALSLIFARSVSRPLIELTNDARAIAAGDLGRRPSISAPGEVGDLAAAFRRLAEQLSARVHALEADDALLRAVTESLNEGVIAIDAREQVVHMNQGARELLGVRDALPFAADRLPRDRVLRTCLRSALSGEAVDAVEVMVNDRTISVNARPLGSGGAVLALFDITPVRRLEIVRRDFVANVSHELKTPLTVIRGFAETLQDEAAPAEQRRQFAGTILSNTQRMQRLVDDLLDLSRIESGGWQPTPSSIDVRVLATEVLAGVERTATSKGVELAAEVGEGAESVFADSLALRQILGNLVDNAVRHTSAGGRVTVFTETSRDGAGTIIGVRDTGAGIPADHLPRVFERFYRVDAARSRQEGGTGLGLAIVRHLVEGHRGRVTVESALGVGTVFRAWFPGKPRPVGTDQTAVSS
jgi:signal transduction histidine kinase